MATAHTDTPAARTRSLAVRLPPSRKESGCTQRDADRVRWHVETTVCGCYAMSSASIHPNVRGVVLLADVPLDEADLLCQLQFIDVPQVGTVEVVGDSNYRGRTAVGDPAGVVNPFLRAEFSLHGDSPHFNAWLVYEGRPPSPAPTMTDAMVISRTLHDVTTITLEHLVLKHAHVEARVREAHQDAPRKLVFEPGARAAIERINERIVLAHDGCEVLLSFLCD